MDFLTLVGNALQSISLAIGLYLIFLAGGLVLNWLLKGVTGRSFDLADEAANRGYLPAALAVGWYSGFAAHTVHVAAVDVKFWYVVALHATVIGCLGALLFVFELLFHYYQMAYDSAKPSILLGSSWLVIYACCLLYPPVAVHFASTWIYVTGIVAFLGEFF